MYKFTHEVLEPIESETCTVPFTVLPLAGEVIDTWAEATPANPPDPTHQEAAEEHYS